MHTIAHHAVSPLTKAAVIALATVALAGCGGSSKEHDRAVSVCHQQGATTSSCQCAVDYASAHGVPPKRMLQEMQRGSAGPDFAVLMKGGISCFGH